MREATALDQYPEAAAKREPDWLRGEIERMMYLRDRQEHLGVYRNASARAARKLRPAQRRTAGQGAAAAPST